MPNFLSADAGSTFAVLVFVAVFLLVEGGWLVWSAHRGREARRLRERLDAVNASRSFAERARLVKGRSLSASPWLHDLLERLPGVARVDHCVQQSGTSWTVGGLAAVSLALAVTALLVVAELLRQPVLLALAAATALGSVPWVLTGLRRARRLHAFEAQLPDALDLMTRALRAGHALSSALKMVGEELQDPVAGEFRIVHDEITYGVAMAQALSNLSDRVPVTDLRYFVVAVIIQRDSGGNLTEILSNLSQLIRGRLKLLSKIRVLTSEGRLSAWILGLMPFGLGAVLQLANPKFMAPLWSDPMGITIVRWTLALMVVGALMLRSIVKIRV